MKVFSRKILAVISTSLLVSFIPGVAVAQSSFSGSSAPGDLQSAVEPSETSGSATNIDASITGATSAQQEVDGPFAQWGIPTPPGAEGYEVNQVAEEDLNPQGLEEWHPTADPNKEIVPGQMRSDREKVPAGVDKAEADKAEIREAQLADPNTPTLNARPGCGVYWPTSFEVCGLIKEKYDSIGGPTSFLLLPKSNELTNPDGVGKRSEFINGFIYWHPKTGAHTVSLPVSKVWQRHGWEKGFLGYPTTSDIPQGNAWYKQDFQGGHVYTHNSPVLPSQASIQGAIYDKWQSMGAHNSGLGYPISDELTTPDGIGRYNVFEHGMIYWTPKTGAQAVHEPILSKWSKAGYERSSYGYPAAPQENVGEWHVRQRFERGEVSSFNGTIASLAKSFGLDDQGMQEMFDVLMKDFAEHGIDSKTGFENLLARSLESLKFNHSNLLTALAEVPVLQSNSDNEAAGCNYIPPGNSNTLAGDVFYSVATTYTYNHGHNDIFVKEGATAKEIETVEAVNPERGVQRLLGSTREGVCAPRLLHVKTDANTRAGAVAFARKQASEGKGYNKKFFVTRIGPLEQNSYNCSQLVWAAYKKASGGGLDIGEKYPYEPYQPAVMPSDILKSHNTYEY
ncbi:Hypothetical protein Cp262_2099 [Corynebacterium pseudotuberculosis]|uniref:hypothetical protein n=1 Tax=Corynebacterium pseudotuberculosis TaxID=1719 RepID=UPI000B42B09C|nr:hypothetical protein [Corynebacterium pseudotuberculosis]ARX64204.1 Hypothetical protein Cp262_2099 [Corynebacterium pseudotuberculosis]